MARGARQLERLAMQAVAVCEPAQAQQACCKLWLLAFEKLTALGSSSKKLIQALVQQLTGMRQGPTRVSLHCYASLPSLSCTRMRIFLLVHPVLCPLQFCSKIVPSHSKQGLCLPKGLFIIHCC